MSRSQEIQNLLLHDLKHCPGGRSDSGAASCWPLNVHEVLQLASAKHWPKHMVYEFMAHAGSPSCYCHHIAIILPYTKIYIPIIPGDPTKPWIPLSPWPQVGWQRYHQVKQLGMLRARRGLERKTGHRMVVACGRYIWKWSNLHIFCTFKMVCHCL